MQPRAAARGQSLRHREQGRRDIVPGGVVSVMHDALRAIRVPELQYRGLREDVGRPEIRRMQGVSLDLGRTPHVVLDQHPACITVARERRGKEARQPVHLTRRRPYVGDDLTLRRAAAGAQSPERKRSTEVPEELPSIEVVRAVGGLMAAS